MPITTLRSIHATHLTRVDFPSTSTADSAPTRRTTARSAAAIFSRVSRIDAAVFGDAHRVVIAITCGEDTHGGYAHRHQNKQIASKSSHFFILQAETPDRAFVIMEETRNAPVDTYRARVSILVALES